MLLFPDKVSVSRTFAILTAILQLLTAFSSSAQRHLSSFNSLALNGWIKGTTALANAITILMKHKYIACWEHTVQYPEKRNYDDNDDDDDDNDDDDDDNDNSWEKR